MVEIRNKEPTRIAKWGRGSGDRELNILCATLKVGERRRALVKESGRQEATPRFSHNLGHNGITGEILFPKHLNMKVNPSPPDS
ncbi:hypothetical protein HZH68_004241 [Vespula germanica]|uniref:Uncharacterized protein n=1 Tax=Vespula germanica TaxID=30212 RepID=A0A834NH18_VESGE|nr:hypothetical protein HZH68_004241 [Vespula germanica]